MHRTHRGVQRTVKRLCKGQQIELLGMGEKIARGKVWVVIADGCITQYGYIHLATVYDDFDVLLDGLRNEVQEHVN